ncbi:hypothetical protein HZH68_001616 [Vespula germanica]|uniref:Uncharacterized protein n=1 Tax=Vespula germanica TaxID=30212 RepID=A0A834NVW0_VESGE|nr:hypothetical protein HZH68_001616 [Vespula germanica]
MENTNISRNNSWLEGTKQARDRKAIYSGASAEIPRGVKENSRAARQGKASSFTGTRVKINRRLASIHRDSLYISASGNVRVRATVAVFRYGSLECSSASSRTLRAKVARRDDYDDNDDNDDNDDDDDDDDDADDDAVDDDD